MTATGIQAAAGAGEAWLRPYQAEAVSAITAGLRHGGRRQLRAACGTGKTLIASKVAAELAGRDLSVVLVPSIPLAAQTLAAWQAGCPVQQVLAVCSDRTVGQDQAVAADWMVPVTTDAGMIGRWLAGVSGRALVVGTYDSAHRIAEGLRRAGRVAGLTVCDEAHRLAGPAGKFTAPILDHGFLPERRRLSMTATPRISGVSARGKTLMISMDDTDAFGEVAYSYPFSRAIAEGYLKGYRVVVAGITDAQVADLLSGEDGGRLADGSGVPLRMAAIQAVLGMTAARYGLRRTLAFLPRVAQARQFAQTLPRTMAMLPPEHRPQGPLSAGAAHGKMTAVQRNLALDRLRRPPDGGWAVVANSRCLSEGVDVPAVDSVLFSAPKRSVTDIIQIAGRALRPHPDADTATIIVPVLLAPGPGDDGWIPADPGDWRHVLAVVRALGAHDEHLGDRMGLARAARAGGGTADSDQVPAEIIVQAPAGTLARTLEALRVSLVDDVTSPWWDGYGHARAYYQEHGNLDADTAYTAPDGYLLGKWLTAQRTERNAGKMPEDRVRLLDAIAMTWDRLDAAWMRAFGELAAFRDRTGHCEVPADLRTADDILLSEWAGTQRDALRDGTLPAGRKDLLDSIGFPWNPRQARWQRQYARLASALDRCGGRSGLPADSGEATWLEGQLLAFHRGKLSDEKIALLEKAGIEVRRPDPWMTTYQAYTDFRKANGHLRIPDGYSTAGGINLSNWQRDQRVRRKAGRMTPEQERLLTEAGIIWDPVREKWNANYRETAAWKQAHGNLRFPRGHRLGGWLRDQQKACAEGRLPADQARLLRGLGALDDPGQGDQHP